MSVFCLLAEAGTDGIAAGEIARRLGVTPNTLSAQLNLLANAGLVRSRRQGRSIIYCADCEAMSRLLIYLVNDCCRCRPEIRARLAEAISRPPNAALVQAPG